MRGADSAANARILQQVAGRIFDRAGAGVIASRRAAAQQLE
jgi:hypothetical protein